MIRRAFTCCAVLLCISLQAHAEYPERPIRITVPFAAGGGIDAAARALAKTLGQELKAQVIVENRPGANSIIGAQAVASTPADGYALLFTSGSTVSVLPHISKLPLDPRKDLVPVGKVAKLPFVLLVHDSVGVTNLREFTDKARSANGSLTYASAGSGTGAHLGFELLKHHARIQATHVPYKSTAVALPDLMTGRVVSMMTDPAVARRAVAAGSVRALAITTKDRSPAFPSVPTVAEQGIPGFDLEVWFGMFAPRGTPTAVLNKLNAAMGAALSSRAGAAAFDELGYSVDFTSAQALESFIERDSAQWAELAKAGALKMD